MNAERIKQLDSFSGRFLRTRIRSSPHIRDSGPSLINLTVNHLHAIKLVSRSRKNHSLADAE